MWTIIWDWFNLCMGLLSLPDLAQKLSYLLTTAGCLPRVPSLGSCFSAIGSRVCVLCVISEKCRHRFLLLYTLLFLSLLSVILCLLSSSSMAFQINSLRFFTVLVWLIVCELLRRQLLRLLGVARIRVSDLSCVRWTNPVWRGCVVKALTVRG